MSVWIGAGSFNQYLAAALQELNAKHFFIIADEPACTRSGAKAILAEQVPSHATVWFSDFTPNPRLEDVERAVSTCRQAIGSEVEELAIIAVGGGTAIDLAKLTAAAVQQPGVLPLWKSGRTAIEEPVTRLLAIPTTAGTGSEATPIAVVYIHGVKHSLEHASLLPGTVIVDSLLTASLPPSVAAATGLDCLCQAIESLWSVRATDSSRADAWEALQLAVEYLVPVVKCPTAESREAMSRAAHLAGRAIGVSRTTAAHALSYHLTSQYGVPHGMAVAIFLGPLLVYNSQITDEDCQDPRGAGSVRQVIQQICGQFGAADARLAAQRWNQMLINLAVPSRLEDVGVQTSAARQQLARSANLARLSNNPRRLTEQAILDWFV